MNTRILKKCDNLNHNLLFLVPDQTTTPESDIPANFNNGIPWDHCTYWVFLSLFDRKHKKGTTYVHCTLFSYVLLCYLMHSARTLCAFSSNSFHRQITQNQLSDPENKKCSPWKVVEANHPQTLGLLSRRGPRCLEARLSQQGPVFSTTWFFTVRQEIQ